MNIIIIFLIGIFIGICFGVFLGIWGTLNAPDMLYGKHREKLLKRLGIKEDNKNNE